MAKEIVRKRVTLHPLKEDGTIDTSINLYPKTFIDGIVDRDGEQVEVQEKLTAGENITIEDNVISAANGGESFPTFTTTEPIVIDKDINITLSQDNLKDILENKYPVIIIKDYEDNVELVFVQAEYVGGESMIEIKYILNDFHRLSDSNFNVLLLIDKYDDTEEIYLNPYFDDSIVNTKTEQDIYARKRWLNKFNENEYTEVDADGITLHNSEDSRLHISAYSGENDFIAGFNVGGKYYDANQELQPIYYDVNFPTAKELPYLGYADYTQRTLALEETIPLSAVIVNPITNLNGFILSEFSYEETTLEYTNPVTHETVSYPCYILSRKGAKVDVASAKLYMQRMTGTRFLPTYNYKNPRNTLFITAAGEFLKPQYDETNGLVLFKIPNPFALKTETTALYEHYVNFGANDDINIGGELYIVDNNPNNVGVDFLTIDYLKNIISIQGWVNPTGNEWDDVICLQKEGDPKNTINFKIRFYILRNETLQQFDPDSFHNIEIVSQDVRKL